MTHFYFYIKTNISSNYMRCTIKNGYINKVMGYYDNNNDKLLFIYQFSNNIQYYTIQNINSLFYYKCKSMPILVKSNTESILDVSQLITYPSEHELLHIDHISLFNTTTYREKSYNNHYIFNKTTQILTVYPSLNDWVYFYYCIYGGYLDRITVQFMISGCEVNVKTCAYKCGSCIENYDICDEGSCRKNFAQKRDSEDTECYPYDQNFPNYIYDSNTQYYEKCYPSCKFCSLKGSNSSNLKHNCLTCNEGYLRSYEYMGNCYKIEYPYNESNIFKIVNNSEEENYTIVNSCLNQNNKFKNCFYRRMCFKMP